MSDQDYPRFTEAELDRRRSAVRALAEGRSLDGALVSVSVGLEVSARQRCVTGGGARLAVGNVAFDQASAIPGAGSDDRSASHESTIRPARRPAQ